MNKHPSLNSDRLKELLIYDPDTGIFTRRVARGSRGRAGRAAGTRGRRGYNAIMIDGRLYYAHRLAFLYMTGEFPSEETDHINGMRDDNRWTNLRAVTNAENCRNMPKSTRNTSGVLGVDWCKRLGKWRTRIQINGKGQHIGLFASLEDAAAARLAASQQHSFHENHGRIA